MLPSVCRLLSLPSAPSCDHHRTGKERSDMTDRQLEDDCKRECTILLLSTSFTLANCVRY